MSVVMQKQRQVKKDERIEKIILQNNIPRDASLLKQGRDPNRTSNRYKETDDVGLVEKLNELGWFITSYKQVKPQDPTRGDFKTYMAVYQNFNVPEIPGEGRVTLVQTNSKDGTQVLKLSMGFDRYVSDLHMIVNTDLFKPLEYKHKGLLPTELNSIIADEALKQIEKVGERVEEMKKVTLTQEQAVDFAQKAAGLRFLDQAYTVKPEDLLGVTRPQDAGMSLWKVLCRVHEALIASPKLLIANPEGKLRKARAIEHIGRELKINKGLWTLAEQYTQVH